MSTSIFYRVTSSGIGPLPQAIDVEERLRADRDLAKFNALWMARLTLPPDFFSTSLADFR